MNNAIGLKLLIERRPATVSGHGAWTQCAQ